MKIFLILVLACAVGIFIGHYAWPKHLPAADKPEEHAEPSHHQRGTNGEVIVRLTKEVQQKMGLKVEAAVKATSPLEAEGFGKVLDASPLTSLLLDLSTARANLGVSSNEWRRVQTLYQQGQNASARSVEAAAAAQQRDLLMVENTRVRILSTWGKAVLDRGESPDFVGLLAALDRVLVRVDLPPGSAFSEAPTNGHLALAVSESRPLPAEFLGTAPAMDSPSQSQSYLFLARGAAALRPGAAVFGWLQFPGTPQRTVMVSRSAVVRHQGQTFVYVQDGEETFHRQVIELASPRSDGWLVKSGVEPGQTLVTLGAQQLLSEERKGSGGEE